MGVMELALGRNFDWIIMVPHEGEHAHGAYARTLHFIRILMDLNILAESLYTI